MAVTSWLLRLEPRGPFRVGSHAEDLNRARALPPSDTLFGALCWAMCAVSGISGLERWLEGFVQGVPPVRLTSMLPVREYQNGLEVLVPMPVRRPEGYDLPDRKFLKRVRYIDQHVFKGLFFGAPASPVVRGDVALDSSTDAYPREAPNKGGGENLPGYWTVQSRPRVTVDRTSGASALFESSSTFWGPAQGPERVLPGVIIAADQVDELKRVVACFEVLGEAGMGGERSSGLGRFHLLEPIASPLPVSSSPAAGMTLALTWPTSQDLHAGALDLPDDRGYRIIERSGWISSPEWNGWRSRRVAMLAEGSYLGGSGPGGGMAEVTPAIGNGHSVYRYGYGLFLEEAAL